MDMKKDSLFLSNEYPVPFKFNKKVVEVFDDMISRSVPLYHMVTSSIHDWVRRYYQSGSLIIDIGCSTGNTILFLAKNMNETPFKALGVDTSYEMIEKARVKLQDQKELSDGLQLESDFHDIRFEIKDAFDIDYSGSSVVIFNYTLQFISPDKRAGLLKKIYSELNEGGIVYISDKVLSDYDEFSQVEKECYEAYKESKGYSKEEIVRKRQALENVLVPLHFSEQLDLFKKAGFKQVDPIIRWNNFMSVVAKK